MVAVRDEIFIGAWRSEMPPRARRLAFAYASRKLRLGDLRAFSIDRNTDSVRENLLPRLGQPSALKKMFTPSSQREVELGQLVPVGGMVSKKDP